MNEWMNETAFDSIVCSFFLSIFAKARENIRAKVDRISHHHHHHHPTWKRDTSSIGISLSPRARLKERDKQEKQEKQEQLHHLPNFDASLGNDVQANGLRNSGLGNREHYL